jgi:hypothetical protein
MLAAERDELALRRFGRRDTVEQLHDRLHLFTEIIVGNADHSRVHRLGVRDEEVFCRCG